MRPGDLGQRLIRAGGPVRALVVIALCVLTAGLLVGDLRYQTKRSGLFPAVATGKWGVSPNGVSVLNADPSVIILTAEPDRRFPYVVNQIARPQRFEGIRIRAEAATHQVQPGAEEWQRARILFWSYDEDGKRMRYLPHELGALDGSTDWRRFELVVPVLPETRLLRFIIYNGGQAGRMFVRSITVDEVTETQLFLGLKAAAIAAWIAVGLWALWPLAVTGLRRPVAGLAVLAGLCVMGGTLAPQPYLLNALQPLIDVAQHVAGPLWPGPPGDAPEPAQRGQPAPAAGDSPEGPVAATPEEEKSVSGQRMSFTPDWAPRLQAGALAHLSAFVLLGLMLALAFPETSLLSVFLYLLVFSIAIETIQGFYVTRTPELGDLAANLAGTPIGFVLAALARRLLRRGRAPV